MKQVSWKKIAAAGFSGFTLLSLAAAGFCGGQAPEAEDRGDSAFITDLAKVAVLAKQNALRNGFPEPALDAYVQQERAKYEKFNKFAREKLVPHSKMLAMGRQEPEKLLAAGEQKLAADKNSWEGHDYVATAKLLKRDAASATEEYARALETAPAEMKGWYQYMLGISALLGREQDTAMGWMDKAIADNNNWLAIKSARLNKAAIYISRQSYDDAAENLDLYFTMAIPAEKKVIAESQICRALVSAGRKVDGCVVK